MHQKVLSMILVLVMLLGLLSVSAFTTANTTSSDSAASNDDSFYRIVHLDCGRKYFPKDWIIALLNEMKADGYNQLQLAFGNDGLRFLLDNMSFEANGIMYSHSDVVSKVKAGNQAQNDSGDERCLTQSQMDDIISAAKALGIEIVPLLNLPGHANAILDIANDAYNASGSNNTLDVANSEAARSFGMAIFQKYVDYFASKGCKFFSFGADEYANDAKGTFSFSRLNSTQYSSFVSFINSLSTYVKSKGMTPRAFNDGLYYNGQSASIDTEIQCCYWSGGWSGYDVATPSVISGNGHAMINTHGDYYYVLGNADKFDSGYSYASSFDNTVFASKYDNKISNPVGSMFCIWCDNPNAENEQTVAQKVRLPMRAMALRMENQSIANMDESVVPNGFNTDGSLNTGSTVTPDTSTSTKDIYVAVNGTATETVSGTYRGPYTTGDTSIATVTTNAAPTPKELKAVTSIESGKQYLIVNNRNQSMLTSDLSIWEPRWHKYNCLKLDGRASETSTELWTIRESGSGYEVMRGSNYLTIGENTASVQSSSAVLTLSYNTSDGYWNISQNSYYLNNLGNTVNAGGWKDNAAPTDDGSKWTIYEITGGETITTLTFRGVAVGTTSVQIGGVTYTIHVTKELPANALTADTITLEHWITNAPVAATSGATGDDRNVQKISKTTAGIQSEDGVAVETLAYVPGYWDKTAVHYWQAVRLDKDHLQTADGGSDQTDKGTTLTHIRYYGGAWQYETADGVWHYFLSTDHFVIYYLQKTEVTKEVDTYVKDWGFDTNKTTPDWSEGKGQVALTVAVVYPDGTVSPAEGNMYANSTTIFNYWNNRDIGIIAPKNNSDYNISKITVTDGTRDGNRSANVWHTDDTITWDKKTTAAGGTWYDETEVWNKSSGTTPMVNGKASNITWPAKNTAKLVLIYLEPVVKNTNLNIVYWDDTANRQINPNTIQISMAYNKGDAEPTYTTALKNGSGESIGSKTSWSSNVVGDENYLPNDAYVVNSSNVHQTISKDMTQIEGIAGNYTSGLYEYRSADISADGKTLTLHYGLKNTGTKTYVVDFGLPVTIPLSDLGITDLNTISWISLKQEDKECLTDHGTYGAATIDKNHWTVTYTLDQTLDNEIAIPINIKFTNSNEIKSFSFHVIPATNVYYEDSFASFTDGTGKAADAKWKTVMDDTDLKATTTQTLSELGSKDVYGHDAAYANSTKLSMGSARKVTVSANMVDDWTDGSAWPSATFTFKGTGFDVISLTDNTSGAIFVDVYAGKEATGTPVKQLTVNNYYGYEQDENGKWVVDTDSSNALYQIPVMKVSGLDYDEYTAVIRVAYSKFFDTANKNQYSFWLDAIRVYDPMGKDNATYKEDGEGYPQYIKLRDEISKDNSPVNADVLFIDGGPEANVDTYKNYGPNNEVYLAKDQAIAFNVPDGTSIASIQIGAKAPNGSAAQMVVNNGEPKDIQSATEMYYKIGTKGGRFTITNTGTGILSLTNLKITYTASGKSVSLAPLTTADQANAVAQVRALFAAPAEPFQPDRFEASWGHAVRKGDTATLTVKASEDVDSITVDGQTITTYDTKTERTGWGWWAKTVTYREFTYQVPAEETTDYTICAVNSAGVSSDPITATLTVRPSVRDWWHGIFDKWF